MDEINIVLTNFGSYQMPWLGEVHTGKVNVVSLCPAQYVIICLTCGVLLTFGMLQTFVQLSF